MVSISKHVLKGSLGCLFSTLVGPRSVVFLKIAKVARSFKNKHLGAFRVSEGIFFEGLLSVDFGAEKALRRYVYNGFSDFLFS